MPSWLDVWWIVGSMFPVFLRFRPNVAIVSRFCLRFRPIFAIGSWFPLRFYPRPPKQKQKEAEPLSKSNALAGDQKHPKKNRSAV